MRMLNGIIFSVKLAGNRLMLTFSLAEISGNESGNEE